jgi:23S rRNA pseudouridine2605 synthase
LAELGIGSRRNIEKLIEMGRVIVNGTRAIIGQRINLNDDVSVNGHRVNLQAKEWIKPRIIMYHKTSGEIVSHADPEGRPSVFDHLPRIRNGKWIAIGRLDFNTEGLLLFTNNGELANNFMHPRFGIEREYAVRVIGSLEEETREQLLKGILLDDGLASFGKIEDAGGENLNHWYRVTLSEGRNREVRRMFEAVGLTVSRLTRIRYGNLSLSSRLQRGKYQELSPEDVQLVLQSFDIQDIE